MNIRWIGFPMPNCVQSNETPTLTCLVLTHPSRYQSGKRRDGSIQTIREDGFNGTAATIWVEDALMTIDR